jgi:hypothetical protein
VPPPPPLLRRESLRERGLFEIIYYLRGLLLSCPRIRQICASTIRDSGVLNLSFGAMAIIFSQELFVCPRFCHQMCVFFRGQT